MVNEFFFLNFARISEKGMLYLPKEVKEILDCRGNCNLAFYKDKKGNIIIKKLPTDKLKAVAEEHVK